MHGVIDLRMELEAVAAVAVRADGRKAMTGRPLRQRREAQLDEVGTDTHHRVEVAHPHLLHRRQSVEQRVRRGQLQVGRPPFAPAVHHLTAVVLGDFLVPEAEAEDRDVEVVDPFV